MSNNTRTPAARTALLWNTFLRRQCHGAMMARVAALALLATLLLASSVAADDSPFLTAPGGPWQYNETTQDFTIYAAQHDPVAPQLDIYKQIADPVYEMESGIFGVSLPLKVPMYLYTDDPQFIAAVPAAQTDKNLYSGGDSGGVYIAIPRMSGLKAPELTLNLRMLMTQQIAATMSGGNLPPGLLHGTALYGEASPAELPALVATLNQQAGAGRLSDWATLANTADPSLAGQQYSVVAFLIDTYGFRQYRAFLTALGTPATHKDWRQALQSVYTSEGPAAATTLEAKWKAYLPQFIGGLWQQNQFTYYNIDQATQLVGIGQYTQAVTLLTPAIAFLQQTGTPKRASDAQALLSKARAGSEAEARVRDAQQALEGNDYTGSKQLLDQARELYKAIPDAKPPLILAQYQQRADRGLQATDDLNRAETEINGWNVLRARQSANRAFATFTEFGNAPLADRAAAVTQRADDRIRMAGVSVIGAGVLILLGGFAVIALRRGRRVAPALPPLD
jgi:hypothetical protein